MTLKQPTPAPDDPRLLGHGTDHDPERGGWYPPDPNDPVLTQDRVA